MKNLVYDRPIAFIDFETTGLNTAFDRIIELTIIKINPDGTEDFRSVRVNPGIPIPAAATEVHGIKDEDVTDKPRFRQYAKSLRDFLDGCDIAGFGVKRFDLPILEAEFKRANVEFSRQGRRILDVQVIYHNLEPRDLAAAYRKYCNKELKNAHSSGEDVRAAVEILECQLQQHPELPRDIAKLHDYSNPRETNWIDADGKLIWYEGEATIDFGQYKGRSLREVAKTDVGYLDWIVRGDFSSEVKKIASKALMGEFPEYREPIQ